MAGFARGAHLAAGCASEAQFFARHLAPWAGRFFDDYSNWERIPDFGRVIRDSGVAQVAAALEPMLHPVLPRPFHVRSLCLFGQANDGMFRLLHRYGLSS
jgi:hypothetical protein